MTETKEENKLKGETNFIGWLRLTKIELIGKNCLLPKTAIATATETIEEVLKKRSTIPTIPAMDDRQIDPSHEDAALLIVTKSISINVLNNIPAGIETAAALIGYAKTEFGSVDAYTRKQTLKKVRMNANKMDPRPYFLEFGNAHAQFIASGGKMTGDEALELLLEGLHQVFYRDLIRSINKKRRTQTTDDGAALFSESKEEIKMYFDDSPPIDKPTAESANLAALANELTHLKKLLAQQAHTASNKFEKRHCEKCAKEGRYAASRTHNTDQHIDGPGYKGHQKGNKPSTPYVYDTGATNHFFKDKPSLDYHEAEPSSHNFVQTADGTSVPIVGVGKVTFGKTILEGVKHVPSFSKNLVSGSALSKSGHSVTLDQDGYLTVKRHGKPVATGEIQNGLVTLHNPFHVLEEVDVGTDSNEPAVFAGNLQSAISWNAAHIQWGHCGKAMIQRTADSQGFTLVDSLSPCSICACSKSNQKARKRFSSLTSSHPLQITQIDVQGPFPITAIDGTCMNVKLVDEYSGYITMKTIPDKSAESIAKILSQYRLQNELKTKMTMVQIATDQGTEFDGAVLDLLRTTGITKLKGVGYRHHLPPKAEKANQDVTKFGRANLLQSKLPASLYNEAQLHAVYTLNRLIHVGKQESPYSLMFNKKESIDHLVPFGNVCYVWIPIEKRSKLEDVRERGRIVGYGNDDELEVIQGYKVLLESSGGFTWSNDVILETENRFQELQNDTAATLNEVDRVLDDPDFTLDEAVVIQDNSSDSNSSTESEPGESESDVESDHSSASPTSVYGTPSSMRHARRSRVNYQESDKSDISDDDGSLYSCNLVDYLQALNISTPEDLLQYSTFSNGIKIPQNHSEAMASDESQFWREAEKAELQSLKQMGTFGKAKLTPKGRRPVKSRWVYAKKFDENNNLIKFKARLVAKGFSQVYGKDYLETFSPVAMLKSIRTLVAIAAAKGMKIHHMDVATAFLNAHLTKIGDDDVTLELPPGCAELGLGDVVRVFRALYGFKQSPREWNQVLHKQLLSDGFTQSVADPCIYFKGTNLYIGIFVDDLFICGRSPAIIDGFKEQMKSSYKMTDLGLLTWYLGMHFTQTDNSIFIDQSQYVAQKLATFNFVKWTVTTPLLVFIRQ